MRRGGPLRRTGELRRRTPLRTVSTKLARRRSAYDAARALVRRRAGGVCEVCRDAPGDQAHHRLRRAQGGSDSTANLLWVCAPCHGFIHDHPRWAEEFGYLVRSGGPW